MEAVLGEAAKFAQEVLEPLNRVGDKEGARLKPRILLEDPAKSYHAGHRVGVTLDEATIVKYCFETM